MGDEIDWWRVVEAWSEAVVVRDVVVSWTFVVDDDRGELGSEIYQIEMWRLQVRLLWSEMTQMRLVVMTKVR